MFHYYAAMSKPGIPNAQNSPVRQPVLLGLFSGTAIGAGYFLAGVANVELMTLITALCGATLGWRLGAACGAVAAGVYSLGSPYGLPAPLLLAGQMAGLACAGVMGAWAGPVVLRAGAVGRRLRASLLAAAAGFAATLAFDLLTNLAITGTLDLPVWKVLAGAVPFVLIHVGVNTVVFALLFPLLTGRLHGLAQAPLLGRGQSLVLLLLTGCALTISPAQAQTAATDPDSLIAPTVAPPATAAGGPRGKLGWRRGLWEPYAVTSVQWLDWRTAWVPVKDGGLGSPVVILGEASTSAVPAFERDGVPLGTGHALADDPWLVSSLGLRPGRMTMGPDLRSGQDGLISLVTDDAHPGQAYSIYRGTKGPHETYQRGISLLTPRAAWRVGFDFDESLDQEGYNFTTEPDALFRAEEDFPGHAKVRVSRTRLVRNLDVDNSLALEYSTGRLTRDALPAWGADHREVWDAGAAATVRFRTAGWRSRAVFFWNSRDVRWGDRPTSSGAAAGSRLLETTREGLSLDLTPAAAEIDTAAVPGPAAQLLAGPFDWEEAWVGAGTLVGLRLASWEVGDSGAAWLPGSAQASSGRGQTGSLVARSSRLLGPVNLLGAVTAAWDSRSTSTVGGSAGLAGGNPTRRWKVELIRAGRPPRSDELLTPVRRDVNGRLLYADPNPDLGREKSLRLQGETAIRLAGLEFAMEGALSRLREGITWVPEPDDAQTGRWANALNLDSSRLTGSISRQGRLLGWGRARLEGTWQNIDIKAGRASLLPPDQYLRMELMWENHFFREDGILQIALFSTRRAAMADPWDLTRQEMLPEVTWHDLILGFRLVGANLSVAIRNLTDQQVRLSAGALSAGREMDLRLTWGFYY